MMWPGHQVIDPVELSSRFSVQDSMAHMDSVFSAPSEESQEKMERIKAILDNLPARESDFVKLYYFRHMKQTAIAELYGVSQPTVCYRLQRATARIMFLLHLPDVTEAELEEVLGEFLDDPKDVRIMVLMFETTCQSAVAKRLGESQGLVRHRFIRSLRRMKEAEDMDRYVQLFEAIQNNLNILREVRRSSKDATVTYRVA